MISNSFLNLFVRKLSKFERIYIIIIFLLITISFFVSFPTDTTNIGVSSPNLAIGDRGFYINSSLKGFGSDDYTGNILYPSIIKIITNFCSFFGEDQYSKLWNFLLLGLTSFLSIISLHLLRKSALFIFEERVAGIVCIIYMMNPYTYYYSLSGGITNFLIIGVTFLLYMFAKSIKNRYKFSNTNFSKDIFLINMGCLYLSCLRPNGAIMSVTILIFLLYSNLKFLIYREYLARIIINIFILLIGILLVTYNLNYSWDYSFTHISLFSNEGGLFFGFPRAELRDKLRIDSPYFFNNIKYLFYNILWKITDFVSGLSDIRDSHNAKNIDQILPFLARTFCGIFIIFPINLLNFFGIIGNIKLIFKYDLWILLLSCMIAISPSLLGVAMSRYLMMFYTPFILFGAKALDNIFTIKNNSKSL